jgi:acyl-CoA hydrolase
MVGVDEKGEPTPVPAFAPATDLEKRRARNAQERRRLRDLYEKARHALHSEPS